MKNIIILTSSELRHKFVKTVISLDSRINTLRTYCESSDTGTLISTIKNENNVNSLKSLHLFQRVQTEKDFFQTYTNNIIDKSNSVHIERKGINYDKIINEIINQLKHRGPDGDGIYKNQFIHMGHTRLRIIDIDKRADQPMVSDCGRYVIVFNGEIYNYKSLRDKFSINNLKTTSDTEILLRLFMKLGEQCTPFLKGMFAFAVWDLKKKN